MKSGVMRDGIMKVVMLLCCLVLAAGATESTGGSKLDVRKPSLDKNGRFWVYKDGKSLLDKTLGLKPVPPYGIPYLPYAWMPEPATKMAQMTLEHKADPYEGTMCIAVSIKWADPYWCGVGFVSGPDKAPRGPWWGKTPYGWYYDLSQLKKKKLVLHMRGEKGGEQVQWKVGFLCHEKYGDSLQFPVESEWLKLEKKWKAYELELEKNNLSRVCSLCFVVAQAQQEDPDAPVAFYIDSIYFE